MCEYCHGVLPVNRIISPKLYERVVKSIFELIDKKDLLKAIVHLGKQNCHV